VEPVDVVRAAGWALAFFAAMQLIRLLMVQVLMVGTEFQSREKRFVCWTGLRGAVPIAMAIQAWTSPVTWGKLMPPLALAVVLFGLVIQGFALVPVAHRLGLVIPQQEVPTADDEEAT
jgi:CPA1 family monovalent cation:H+ antiporter/cell volume regulation protein A